MYSEDYKLIFPKTAKYDIEWIKKNSLLHNTFFYLESLCSVLNINKGMKLLDLGCGKAISSIFLSKEYGAKVWALDKEVSPTKNYQRIIEMGSADDVFPIKADARQLPFPHKYFDIVISIDSFNYYGTDDWYLPYIAQFIKPGGYLGISEWCFAEEVNSISDLPRNLIKCYTDAGFYALHSLEWWKYHMTKSGLFEISNAEVLPENDFLLKDFVEEFKALRSEDEIVKALQQDNSNFINIFRIVVKRTDKIPYFDDMAGIDSI